MNKTNEKLLQAAAAHIKGSSPKRAARRNSLAKLITEYLSLGLPARVQSTEALENLVREFLENLPAELITLAQVEKQFNEEFPIEAGSLDTWAQEALDDLREGRTDELDPDTL